MTDQNEPKHASKESTDKSAESKQPKSADSNQTKQTHSTLEVLKFSFSKEGRAVRSQRVQASNDADKARREAKSAEKRAKMEAYKASIWDGWIHDEDGKPLRKHSRSEKFFDNKPLSIGVCALIVIIPFILLLLLNPDSVGVVR